MPLLSGTIRSTRRHPVRHRWLRHGILLSGLLLQTGCNSRQPPPPKPVPVPADAPEPTADATPPAPRDREATSGPAAEAATDPNPTTPSGEEPAGHVPDRDGPVPADHPEHDRIPADPATLPEDVLDDYAEEINAGWPGAPPGYENGPAEAPASDPPVQEQTAEPDAGQDQPGPEQDDPPPVPAHQINDEGGECPAGYILTGTHLQEVTRFGTKLCREELKFSVWPAKFNDYRDTCPAGYHPDDTTESEAPFYASDICRRDQAGYAK